MEPPKIAKHLIEGWSMTSRPSKIGEAFFGFWSSAILVKSGTLSGPVLIAEFGLALHR